MKDILLTGNLAVVTESFLRQLGGERRVILCGNSGGREYKQKYVIPYDYREDDNEFHGIFQSYDLDTVVFVSRVADGQKRLYDEIERLENALYCSGLAKVRKFIYVTTNDYVGDGESARTRLLCACEELCRKFSADYDTDVTVIRTPYLFSEEQTGFMLEGAVREALSGGKITLFGRQDQVTDFLSDSDLGELIGRVMDEPLKGFCRVDVSGGNVMTFGEVAELIRDRVGECDVTFCGYKEAVPEPSNDGVVRKDYGWFPVASVGEAMDGMIKMCRNSVDALDRKKKRSARSEKISKFVLAAVEMAAFFLLSEFLSRKIPSSRIDYVDFRLLFVIIMGTVHGTEAGIFASILASAGYFAKDAADSNLQIIFFNIENWLPFAAYFLSGTIVGHVRDKNSEALGSLKQQQEILEKKYVFLNELYGKTLEKKEDYSRQIVGYQDSFGKIYQVVRRLNSAVTDQIFYEAVSAMEELLETSGVAIYAISGDSHFARLNVCSREINAELSKSLDMEKYGPVWEALREKNNWVNLDGMEGYPAYAAPIFREEQLTGMIFLWHREAGQMKTEYYNKFNILCGLVQDALVRAIEYSEFEEQRRLVPGTRFLQPEYFEQLLQAKKELDKNGMSDYVLLEIQSKEREDKISETVSSGIRNTDVLGKGVDGKLYLLLNQADKKSVLLVKERLEPKGIRLKAC